MSRSQLTSDKHSPRILIVDDHAAVRAGLRHLISSRMGWDICGEAADGEQAVSLALRHEPSVIVMDISMPKMDGLEATRQIRKQLPDSEVVIVSQHDSENVVFEAQRAGARGFVVKSHLSADLLPALEAALGHSSRISAPVAKLWQDSFSSTKQVAIEHFSDPGPQDDLDLMSGGGAMGALMRSYDWSMTPVGPVSSWPQSLRTALRICLDSRFPILIWWGPQLRLLYNDAYRPALGTAKHPQALGAPGQQVWCDVWDTVGPLLESVVRTGKATWESDQLLLFNRYGYVEESYWTYSFSALRLASGEVGGVFSVVHEVTDRVLSSRRLKTLREVADQAVQAKSAVEACTLAMHSIMRNPADCPFATIFLCDEQQAYRAAASFDAESHIPSTIDLSNVDVANEDSWHIGEAIRSRKSQVFSIRDSGTLPKTLFGDPCHEAISIPLLGRLQEPMAVLTLGISPYRKLDEFYREFFEYLAKNLAANISNAKAYAEQVKLRLDAELLAAIVASSDDAIISKNLDGIITSWNQSSERIFGYTANEAIGQHITLIIPPERRDEETRILNRLRAGQRLDHIETIRRRKNGELIDISLTISPIRDSNGHVIGASKIARDVSEKKRAEQREEQITAESIAANAKFRAVFEQTTQFAGIMTKDGVMVDANRLCLDACGYSAEEVLGKVFWETPWWRNFPESQAKIKAATALAVQGIPYRETLRYSWADATDRLMDFALYPIIDKNGDSLFLHPTGVDITEQKRSEENYRKLAETLELEVRARTGEVEKRNQQVMRQSEQLRELSWHLLRIQDEERRHIARELHDSAGQTLAVLTISLRQMLQKLRNAAPEVALEETADQLQREIRTTSYLLHPPLLDEAGLSSALDWYVRGLTDRSGLEIELEISDDFGRLPRDMELVVFRVVQECLTNIHRHSGSKTASIRIWREPEAVKIEVRDRGKGIPPDKLAEVQSQGAGVGIRGMSERVRQFKGHVHIESNHTGTRVLVTIPICKNKPEISGTEPLRAAV